jgi:hypothetical protein
VGLRGQSPTLQGKGDLCVHGSPLPGRELGYGAELFEFKVQRRHLLNCTSQDIPTSRTKEEQAQIITETIQQFFL